MFISDIKISMKLKFYIIKENLIIINYFFFILLLIFINISSLLHDFYSERISNFLNKMFHTEDGPIISSKTALLIFTLRLFVLIS
jgi:hypothetical protein